MTPGKRYATDDKPPVAADAAERGFSNPSVCGVNFVVPKN